MDRLFHRLSFLHLIIVGRCFNLFKKKNIAKIHPYLYLTRWYCLSVVDWFVFLSMTRNCRIITIDMMYGFCNVTFSRHNSIFCLS